MSATIDLDPRDVALPGPDLASGAAIGRPEVARRLTLTGAGVLGTAVVLWAFLPFVFVAAAAVAHHRIFVGVAGVFPWDGLQYLAYVRNGHSGLIPNLYGTTGSAVFVHPVWSLSGIAQGLTGVGPVAIMAFWKAAGAGALFGGARWLVHRHVPAGGAARTVALGLCLFGGLTPVALPMFFGSNRVDLFGTAVDLVPVATLWDYAPIAIAIGLLPFAVEGIGDVVNGSGARRGLVVTALCCLLVGWLHPWQGATLALVAVALLAWRCAEERAPAGVWMRSVWALVRSRGRKLIILASALSAPIAYYALLSAVDPSWRGFSARDAVLLKLSFPALVWCVLPVTAIYLATARRVHLDRRLRPLVAWGGATLVLLALHPPEQYHALDGLMLPVGILVVRAWPRRAPRRLAAAALILLGATFAGFAVVSVERLSSPWITPYMELRPADVSAVDAASRVAAGTPILTTNTLGSAVPALVPRSTWIGNQFWTTDYENRYPAVIRLMSGLAPPAALRAIVRSSGARAVIVPCRTMVALEPVLRPLGFQARTIGCAQLFTR